MAIGGSASALSKREAAVLRWMCAKCVCDATVSQVLNQLSAGRLSAGCNEGASGMRGGIERAAGFWSPLPDCSGNCFEAHHPCTLSSRKK